MSPSRTITIIGSLNTDLVTTTPRVPSGGETLTATSFKTGAGGKGANQAVAAARLSRPQLILSSQPPNDISVKMLGAVGADEFGPSLIKGMQADGINMDGVSVLQGQTTGVAVILVESGSGENRILLNPGANNSLQPEDFEAAESLGSPKPDLVILQLEIPLKTVLRILELCKQEKIPVLLNPAPAVLLPEQALRGLDHLIVNESEAAILSGRNVEEVEAEGFDWGVVTDDFLGKGVGNIVVTLGSKGAYFSRAAGKGEYVAAQKVAKVVDTTAAGDTFVGAYAVAVVRDSSVHWDIEQAVRWACKAAGRTVEKEGAQSAIPWADQVDKP